MPSHKTPNATSPEASLIFPFAEPPRWGELQEVAAGILWTRMPLPFRIGHVNIYFIDDGDGWAVLDTGMAGEPTRLIWESLLKGPLAGQRLTRLIVSHAHADHVGLAGWLCKCRDMPLLMTLGGYLGCLSYLRDPDARAAQRRIVISSHG
ncbi:MBL fold metallo-hydrolase [Microvirga sp. 0TCS3.31]